MPFVIRNHLDGGAGAYGLVLAAGGLGSIAGAVAMGHLGMPKAADGCDVRLGRRFLISRCIWALAESFA